MRLEPPAITIFQDNTIPADCRLAGWAALVHAFAIAGAGTAAELRLRTAYPRQPPARTGLDRLRQTILARRYSCRSSDLRPSPRGLDLLILKRVFEAAPQAEIEAFVRAAPTGIPARRAWYLYETLTGRTLSLDDAPQRPGDRSARPQSVFHG